MKYKLKKFNNEVIEIAKQKSENFINEIRDKKSEELSNAQSPMEKYSIRRKYDKIIGEVHEVSAMSNEHVFEHYRKMTPNITDLQLPLYSRHHLYLKPKYGVPLLKAAYREHYQKSS